MGLSLRERETTEISPLPYIPRINVPPPGLLHPEILQHYGLLDGNPVAEIERSDLSPGAKGLLLGILKHGGVAKFSAPPDSDLEFDLGINYDRVFKHSFKVELAWPAVEELGSAMRTIAESGPATIDALLAPEHSAIKLATLVGKYLDGIDVHSVRKNGGRTGEFAVNLPGYTKNQIDTLWLDKATLLQITQYGRVNLGLIDDIIDTGTMSNGISLIIRLAQKEGFPVELTGIGSMLEKTYTAARSNITDFMGPVPIHSVLKIADMGIIPGCDEKWGWIKAEGMKKAVACNLADLRPKT